jgi:hypothetical protein
MARICSLFLRASVVLTVSLALMSCGSGSSSNEANRSQNLTGETCANTQSVDLNKVRLQLDVETGSLYAQNPDQSAARVSIVSKSGGGLIADAKLIGAQPVMKCCGGTPEQKTLSIKSNGDGSFEVENLFFDKAGEWLLNVQFCAQNKAVFQQVEFPVPAE